MIVDFSRAIFLAPEESTKRLVSLTQSSPPELVVLIGGQDKGIPFKMNGEILRKSDAWAIGVLLYTMITGVAPFSASTTGDFITNVLTQQPVIPINDINASQSVKGLLHSLLEKKYMNRLSIDDALKHTWFKQASKDALPQLVTRKLTEELLLAKTRNWISAVR